jgi:hypothetical protein
MGHRILAPSRAVGAVVAAEGEPPAVRDLNSTRTPQMTLAGILPSPPLFSDSISTLF